MGVINTNEVFKSQETTEIIQRVESKHEREPQNHLPESPKIQRSDGMRGSIKDDVDEVAVR